MTQTVSRVQDKSEDDALKVLIVDDHELFRRGLRDLINTIRELKVIGEAASSREALSIIAAAPVDLVILDLSLSDGSALPVVQIIRERAAAPSVIVLSASIDDDALLQAMLSGASGYLTKDLTAPQIAKLLYQFSQGGLALAPGTAGKLIQLLIDRNRELEEALRARLPDSNSTVPAATVSHAAGLTHPAEEKPAPTPSLRSLLTPQEEKIYQLMKQGKTNKEIAKKLSISHYTVGKHVQNILHKLKVMNRTQAVSYTAFEGGDSRESV